MGAKNQNKTAGKIRRRKRRRANRRAGAGQDKVRAEDAVEPGPGITPNVAHLHAMSTEANQRKNTEGEEGGDRCDVSLSEARTVMEGGACNTDDTEERRIDKDPGVVLKECANVEFELRDNIPGLKYQQGVETGWTPVRHRRKRNKSTQSSGSESDGVMEQWIQRAKKIDYDVSEEDDQPGITVYTRNMLHWFPVKPDPTPVARRTRAKYKL